MAVAPGTTGVDAGSMADRPATAIDPVSASAMLADWGFLAHPDLPDGPGPAYLLVAIRPRPTLQHYDPELVEYWVTGPSGFGVRETLTFASRLPRETAFSWGRITISDRLGVLNSYLTFGGELRAGRVGDEVVCVFESPAPLLRRGGHSQGWDNGARSVGGYFGRLRAAAGYEHAFELSAAAADPVTRYASFVHESLERYRSSEYLRDSHPGLWTIMLAEERRLQRDHALAWADGRELLRQARLCASGGYRLQPPPSA
jgi:hypothetical protein